MVTAAAVVGREADAWLLERVVAGESAQGGEIDTALGTLFRKHILEEARPGRVRFLHDKLRESAYELIDAGELRRLHRVVAEVLCTKGCGESDAAVLARHYERAGCVAEAVAFQRQAARHSFGKAALRDAAQHHADALRLIARLPPSSDRLTLEVDARLDAFPSYMHLFGPADDRTVALTRRLVTLADRLGEPNRLARARGLLSGCHFGRGEMRRCVAVARSSVHRRRSRRPPIAWLDQSVPLEFRASAAVILVIAYFQRGDLQSVDDLATSLTEELEAEGRVGELLGHPYPPFVAAAAARAVSAGVQGRFAEAEHFHRLSLTVAKDTGHKYGQAIAEVIGGCSCYFRGDGAGAARAGDAALSIARQAHLASPQMMGLYTAGIGFVMTGQIAEGVARLEEGLRIADELGYQGLRSDAYYGLALGHLMKRRFAAALSAAEAGLRFSARSGEVKLVGELQRIAGEALSHGSRPDRERAAALLRQSLAFARAHRMPLTALRTLAAFARLHRATGRERYARRRQEQVISEARALGLATEEVEALVGASQSTPRSS